MFFGRKYVVAPPTGLFGSPLLKKICGRPYSWIVNGYIIIYIYLLGGENNALTEEDPQTILNELSTTFCRQKFDILFCDETASQSGRILPLEVVSTFCRQHSIKLIVDGTQSCQLLFAKNKHDILDQVKYRWVFRQFFQ